MNKKNLMNLETKLQKDLNEMIEQIEATAKAKKLESDSASEIEVIEEEGRQIKEACDNILLIFKSIEKIFEDFKDLKEAIAYIKDEQKEKKDYGQKI